MAILSKDQLLRHEVGNILEEYASYPELTLDEAIDRIIQSVKENLND